MAKRPSPFSKNYAPRGFYQGERGSPEAWRSAFSERFSPAEIKEILGDDNPWQILGIAPGSDLDTIKKAYRSLAMKHHPDHGGDAEQFKRIKAAYDQIT